MTEQTKQAPQAPPEVLRYLNGAPPESRQFDFLIGDWDVASTRYHADGSVLLQYNARWNAKHLNDGRMIVDDFQMLAPTGQEVSSYVTLRTYSQLTGRWEVVGLSALQPAVNAEWYGQWQEGEMRVDAVGTAPDGGIFRNRIRFFNIHESSFEWESNFSRDDGVTWLRAVSMLATRATR